MPQIPGITINMGGQDLIVPPLSLGDARRLWPKISKLQTEAELPEPERMEIIAEVVHAALARNYPAMTPETVADELLDMGNFSAVFAEVMSGSGFKMGEAQRAAATPIGAASTDSSSPPAGTPIQ